MKWQNLGIGTPPFTPKSSNSSHENKVLRHFIIKIFLIENECETPYETSTLFCMTNNRTLEYLNVTNSSLRATTKTTFCVYWL